MDLVNHQNSSSGSGLGICGSLGVLSGDSRMQSSYTGSGGGGGGGGGSGGPLSPNLSSMKQCRSTSDVEVEPRDEGGPLKLARKDSFSYRQGVVGDKQANLNNGGAGLAGGAGAGAGAGGAAPSNNNNSNNNGPAGSNSFSGDNGAGRIACSPTNSCLSDGVLVATDAAAAAAANLMGDTRMLRNDPMAGAQAGGAPGYNLAPASSMRPFSYQSYQYGGAAAAGSPLMLAAAAARGDHHLGMQSAMGMRGPFTANQWAELEHQALIFKYMMAGASVPPELLNPIRRSVALNNLASSHPSLRMGWGNFHLGIPNNPDPEPGRCRRTDGKKWRCSREVVADQKYCDRHMHRGRNRSKKNAENQAAAAAAAAAANSQSAAAAAAGAQQSPGANVGVVQNPGMSHQMHHHSGMRPPLGMNGQQQNHAAGAGPGSPFGSGNKSNSSFNQLPTGIPSGNNSNNNNNSSPSSLQFPMQSLSGASPGGNKDYRYMNGMIRPELGLGAEQMFFSDSSSWQQHQQQQQQHQHHQSFGKFPRLSSGSNTSSSNSSNSPLYQPHHHQQHQQQQQLRSFSGAFGMSEVNHHPLLTAATAGGGGGGGYGAPADPRDSCEEQPLRHFFDDWPRHHNRDPTALSWNDIDDEKVRAAATTTTTSAPTSTISTSHATTSPPLLPPPTSGSASSATHLSISLPMSSPDFRLQGTSPRGKLSLSPLKLSMSRSEFDEDPLGGGGDPGTRMGLGVGLGISHQHKQWVHHQSAALEGGPLAEVLHSSGTPRDSCRASPPGLNLLGDASWESSSRETSRMPSPTAVLKTPFGSFSDSSSNASSPRAVVQSDAAAAMLSKQQLTS